jgi:hypothetical protein
MAVQEYWIAMTLWSRSDVFGDKRLGVMQVLFMSGRRSQHMPSDYAPVSSDPFGAARFMTAIPGRGIISC